MSLNAGFTCPHKVENEPLSGCIFCNESGFSPNTGNGASLREQLETGISKLGKKYSVSKFIAYFQNATGTNASVQELKECYDVIKDFQEIESLYISTRPDCVDSEKLDLIAEYTDKYEVWLEFGIQTVHDRTLNKLNRGHTHLDSVKAVKGAAARGIKVGAHVILGLPGETGEDMIETAEVIAGLPVNGIKLHVLHVLRETVLEKMYSEGKIKLFSRKEYISNACDFMEYTDPSCVMFRLVSDAYKDYLIAPDWINDKSAVINGINKEFERRGTCQGAKYKAKD